jgi:hypothetical protein
LNSGQHAFKTWHYIHHVPLLRPPFTAHLGKHEHVIDGHTCHPASPCRLKYGIRRDLSGRAQLRRSNGTWMQCKLDMEVAGTMLLRDTSDGSVHVLQTDKLEQVRRASWLSLVRKGGSSSRGEAGAMATRVASSAGALQTCSMHTCSLQSGMLGCTFLHLYFLLLS